MASTTTRAQGDPLMDLILGRQRTRAERVYALLICGLALAAALYGLAIAYYQPPESMAHRSIFLTLMLVLCFLVFPLSKKPISQGLTWHYVIDWICIALAIAIHFYVTHDLIGFDMRAGIPSRTDVIMGTVLIALVLEASRRTIGWTLVLVAGFFIAHAVYADYFYGIFFGPPTSWRLLISTLFLRQHGVYGVPIEVMSTYVILFILFGSLLLKSGAGDFFTRLAFALTGRQTGGPAKAAVVSSALMGTVSGSSIANVVTTGTFTIPLMKRLGYNATTAGAVEAVASTGGMILPPVMGAVAFLMAQFLGVHYFEVAKAALIPALLYYIAVYMFVHFEAQRLNLGGLAAEELPRTKDVLREGGHLLLPLLLIVFMLMLGRSVMAVGFWGIISVIVIGMLRPDTRFNGYTLLNALVEGVRPAVGIAMACATAGLIVGAVFASGVGMKFALSLVDLAGNSLFLTLLLTAVACIVLGMAIAASAVYVTGVALMIPALTNLGVDPMAANLFVVYYSVISVITPPVAVAAFAAAGVAKAPPMATGWQAFRIGLVAYIVPFLFVYHPTLLMQGEWYEILRAFVTGSIGAILLAGALVGWLIRKASLLERGLLLVAALLLMDPVASRDLLGLVIAAAVLGLQLVLRRREAPAAETAGSLTAAEEPALAMLDTPVDEGDALPIPQRLGAISWVLVGGIIAALMVMGNMSLQVLRSNLYVALVAVLAFAAVVTLAVLGTRSAADAREARPVGEHQGMADAQS